MNNGPYEEYYTPNYNPAQRVPVNDDNLPQEESEPSCLSLQPPKPAAMPAVVPSPLPTPVPPLSPLEPNPESECVTDIVPQIQNVVSTFNLKCSLKLRDIASKARNAEYNPKRFAALIMRIRDPKTTALIFSSGKIVCAGAKSPELSRLAARKHARIIQKLGYPAKFTQFQIQNIVGSCDVKFHISLEGLVVTHSHFCSYEPELFPGLIYRMVQPKVVLLVFVSGKIVLTGAKVEEDILEAFQKIYPMLRAFMKPQKPSNDNQLVKT